jgi:hypothetical protein
MKRMLNPNPMRKRHPGWGVGKALILFGACSSLFLGLHESAFSQQVDAALSQEFVAVGQPVQLNVSVSGARGAQVPQTLKIEGLDARFAGKSEQQQMQFGSGGYTRAVTATYTYLIVPLQEGTFTIPPIPVAVDGKRLQTKSLTLRVNRGGGGAIPVRPAVPVNPGAGQSMPQSPPSNSNPTDAPDGKTVFGELLVPKATAYAGEVVPAEIRFYFDARYQVRLQDRPGFSGDGFTVLDLSKPIERQQEVDGTIYNVVSFQTAITPAKSGRLEIPGATLEAQIQSPSSTRSRQDDFFGGIFGQTRNASPVTIATDPAELEVTPLPKEGRPESFGGAIGQFSLGASATPKKAVAGDPISLNVTVSGRGNFDAMGPPLLVEDDGWRTYPPGEKFVPSPSDPIGFNGEKRYEFMLLAREDREATPVAEFAFFDPALEKYVTLKSAPIAVVAQGGTPVTPAVVASATPGPSSPAAPVAEVSPEEVLQTGDFVPATFIPLLTRGWVIVGNGMLAVAWCLVLLVVAGRRIANSPRARQAAALRETRRLLKTMEDSSTSPEQFFQYAEEFVRTRLAGPGNESAGIDPRERLDKTLLPEETEAAIRAVLDRHDASRYSTATLPLDASERQEILNHLKTLDVELQK